MRISLENSLGNVNIRKFLVSSVNVNSPCIHNLIRVILIITLANTEINIPGLIYAKCQAVRKSKALPMPEAYCGTNGRYMVNMAVLKPSACVLTPTVNGAVALDLPGEKTSLNISAGFIVRIAMGGTQLHCPSRPVSQLPCFHQVPKIPGNGEDETTAKMTRKTVRKRESYCRNRSRRCGKTSTTRTRD